MKSESTAVNLKGRFRGAFLCMLGFALTATTALAQTPPGPHAAPDIRAIEVNEPAGQILSFRHLAGSTVVEMRGTKIMPSASIQMKIGSRPGFVELDINRGEIKHLEEARRFGRDFLTYVLWAVSVDGQAANLGEITFENGQPVSINVTTTLQTFWLMVTAEPDFAVDDPSPVVVLYNTNQDNVVTGNKALPVPGKLLYYSYYANYDTSPAAVVNLPNELLQARKAIELASNSGILASPTPEGEQPLADELRTRATLQQAREFLNKAEKAYQEGGGRHEGAQFARTAVQIAENSRALALGAVGGINLRLLERELDKTKAEAARLRESSQGHEQELARLQARVKELEAELEQERAATKEAAARADAAEKSVGDAAKRAEAAEARAEDLRRQLANLDQTFQQSLRQVQQDREQVCGELRRQLSSLGQLTNRGGEMVLTLASDILFDFGSYELRPTARENLAKLAVLRLMLFPQADVHYEGHTDLVGEDDYNQWLSEQRALAVYKYFLEQGQSLGADSAGGGKAADRLVDVNHLLGMNYAVSRKTAATRQQLLAELGGAVVGKGEREPVEQTTGPSERNRRVVLLFPPPKVGQLTSLCAETPAQQSQQP